METYTISNQEIIELKQTMGFRVNGAKWTEFADEHPDGCTNIEMIDLVKRYMNPPFDETDIDAHLERILKMFVAFVR